MPADESARRWTFLTNHAHVLLRIAADPDSRIRDLADQVGITERAAHRIVTDLAEGGYISTTKVGRRNTYEVHRDARLRHPLLRELGIGELIDLLERAAED